MSLELEIEENSQTSTNHGVAFCKNSATNQAYCLFSEDLLSLQFISVDTSLWDIGYDDIHFLHFSSRAN